MYQDLMKTIEFVGQYDPEVAQSMTQELQRQRRNRMLARVQSSRPCQLGHSIFKDLGRVVSTYIKALHCIPQAKRRGLEGLAGRDL